MSESRLHTQRLVNPAQKSFLSILRAIKPREGRELVPSLEDAKTLEILRKATPFYIMVWQSDMGC